MEAPEKIYLSNYSSGVTYNWHNERLAINDIEYIRKDALVKYLYEEKGYPITLNGELVHWDELNKHLAEYIKWKKDAIIEKVCKFLDDRIKHDSIDYPMATPHLIDDVKNYMKEE
jgi:hypothetical protein